MNVSVSYEPTAEELTRGLKRGQRRNRRFLWAISVLALAVAAAMLAADAGEPAALKGGVLGIGLVFPVLLTLGTKRAVARQAPRLCRPTQATFTNEGLSVASDQWSVELAWSAFSSFTETDEFFICRLAKNQMHLIPKRAFDAQQAAEVSAFLAGHGGTAGSAANFAAGSAANPQANSEAG